LSLRITVKTSEPFKRYLPAGSQDKTAELELPEGATATDVLKRLGFPSEQNVLIILNESALPKAQRAERALENGDFLTILSPLKGG
jgi:sulfur carrier protein ThiS